MSNIIIDEINFIHTSFYTVPLIAFW